MISVVMATYNGEKFLNKQLDSILNQSLKIDELIICDDCSNDRTVDIIHSYQEKYDYIKLYENENNLGYKLNFKKAMEICKGEYIFLCDQDDIWMLDKVEKMVNKIDEISNVQALASSFIYIDKDDNKIEMPLDKNKSNNNLYLKPVKKNDCVCVGFEEFYNCNYFQGCSLLIRKDLKDWVVDNFSTLVSHDYFINFTAAKENGMYFWNVPLFKYRLHDNNTLGVFDDSIGFFERLKVRNSFFARSIRAVDGLHMLEALKETDSDFYNKNKDYYDKKIEFYKSHIECLENKNFFKLLKQSKNPYYKEFKSGKARFMDLVFVLFG